MKIQLSSLDVLRTRTDCLVVGVRESAQQPPSTRKIEKASKGLIARLLRSGDIDGRPGSTLLVPSPSGIQQSGSCWSGLAINLILMIFPAP